MNAIIISHFKNDIKWVENVLNPNIFIYSKINNNPKFIFYPFTQGQEVNVYLKFIIDHYFNLPDKCLFLHDHQKSWHQDFNTDFICNSLNWNLDSYFSINKRTGYEIISWISPPHARQFQLLKTNWDFLFEGLLEFPREIGYYMGGQFVVNKNNILKYPLKIYEKWLNWINNAKDPMTPEGNVPGQLFEWTWNYIFTNTTHEKKYQNSEFLII